VLEGRGTQTTGRSDEFVEVDEEAKAEGRPKRGRSAPKKEPRIETKPARKPKAPEETK